MSRDMKESLSKADPNYAVPVLSCQDIFQLIGKAGLRFKERVMTLLTWRPKTTTRNSDEGDSPEPEVGSKMHKLTDDLKGEVLAEVEREQKNIARFNRKARASAIIWALAATAGFCLQQCSYSRASPEEYNDNATIVLQTIMVAFESITDNSNKMDDHLYDTDSYLIAIDSGSSRCITNNKNDFVGPTKRVSLRVRGIGGDSTATIVGTVRGR